MTGPSRLSDLLNQAPPFDLERIHFPCSVPKLEELNIIAYFDYRLQFASFFFVVLNTL